MIYVGTSGFSYKEWKGNFYPEKLPAKEYLAFYAESFSTTEINNTFYRIPSTSTVTGWAEQVPESFRFALKLSQRITHRKRLRNVDEEMEWFLTSAGALADKLACILVQLPPNFKKDMERLGDFVGKFSSRAPLAVEFRHPTWFSEDVFDLLSEHAVSLGVVEADESPATRRVTAPFVYMRLRKTEYTDKELQEWAGWVRAQSRDVFVYLKHDVDAPGLANRLLRELG